MFKLLVACFLFLISLLTIFPAPAFYLWLLAIIVDEYPWIFIAILLIILCISFNSEVYRTASVAMSIITIGIFLYPIVCSWLLSRSLPISLKTAFDTEAANSKIIDFPPFSFGRFLRGKEVVPYKTLTYKKTKDYDLTLDFYSAVQEGKKPCVIIIHGGSWKSGDSKQLPELNSLLAAWGFHVAAINYRLAPKFQSPAQVEDVRDVIGYLKTTANMHQIDTTRFVLLGRSAGAQIALLAGYTLHEPNLRGIIDFYGPTDMVWGYSIPSNPLIMDSRKVMEDYLGGTYSKVPAHFENSSPLFFVNEQSPPTLIIHGKNDVLVAFEHSRRLDQKLTENRVPHYLLSLPWATHAFDYNLYGPGGQLSTYAVLFFLHAVTK